MTDRVRVLAMDHYFDQDLRALEAHPRLDIRRFPYQRLRGPAIRILGAEVATGLRAYARPGLEPQRRRYGTWLVGEVRRLYLERAFDVIVLPSDTFFYVRGLPEAAHALGVPVVVVQKETTISEATMEAHSAEMQVLAPFTADFMTVCSERHRQFWQRTGADRSLIEVTGQPRFDLYASQRATVRSARRRVLFLTYQLDAYVPGAGRGMGLRTWGPLRDATEAVLLDAVRQGGHEVVVKCHPQQDHRAEASRLAARAGPAWNHGLSLAAMDADTRELIVASDLVIGFQTTAMYETVAAGRTAVYAAWGEEYERYRDRLIPFHQAPPGCVHHATSAERLAALVASPPALPAGCADWYEEALGPVDGYAVARVADRLSAVAAAWPPSSTRRELELQRRRFAVGLLVRSATAEAVWTLAAPVARVAGQERRVRGRRKLAGQRRAMATVTLRRRPSGH